MIWGATGQRAFVAPALRLAAALFMAATLWLGLTGCSGSSPTACPNDYPASCPDGAATFAAGVAPLIQSRCSFCHGSGQQRPTLQTYAEIHDAAPVVIMQMLQCSMPPPPQPPLTTEERRVLLSWLACGAMNN